jgi:protein-S-isoprenylcysteine O-methyltransferase Ste14
MPISPTAPPNGSNLQDVQYRRKLVFMVAIALWILLLLFTQSSWRNSAPHLFKLIQLTGLFLILVCILGRTWCTLYIGGLKKRELVVKGPYSVVRNPLYVFTAIGAVGVGAQSGSALAAVVSGLLSLAIFAVVVRREESFLAAAFPESFADYAARVPRFWPRLSVWQEADELLVRPRLVRQTFLDACMFLLAVPATALMDWLQGVAEFPVLFHLP